MIYNDNNSVSTGLILLTPTVCKDTNLIAYTSQSSSKSNLHNKNHYIILRHGTRCAGVIAGKRSGGTCRNGGIAYNAQLAGQYEKQFLYG